MKNVSSVLWGLVLIVVGVILGLNMFGVTNIDLFFDGWWTLFIIIPCFINLFKDEKKTGNIIGLMIGILLFLANQDFVDFDFVWKLSVPLVLIVIGISCVFKSFISRNISDRIKELNKDSEDKNEYVAAFSGQKLEFFKEDFKGCDLQATFGGIDLDLTTAKIKKDVVINVCAIFGGVNIKVPNSVNVKINSNSIFGGVNSKVNQDENNKVNVYINATCLFGGVEIK